MELKRAALLLGGEACGRNQVVCPGPGHSRADRSLSVRFDAGIPDGFIVHSFSGDDPIKARDYVRERLGLAAWQPGDGRDRRVPSSHRKEFDQIEMDREAERRSRSEDDLLRIKRAAELWHEAKEPRRTAAEQYLRSRALDLPDDLADAVLRFHAKCPWRNEETGRTDRIPALIAAFRSIDDNTITGVHRIRLDQPQRWPKTERKMLGVVRRTAIKLDPITGGALVIGEGVETCLAARQLELGPAWALGSVGAISFFPVLDDVKELTILAEAGQPSAEAIKICAQRWRRSWRRVHVAHPATGSDLNDALMEAAR
jgi:putative DNA primase/helicase